MGVKKINALNFEFTFFQFFTVQKVQSSAIMHILNFVKARSGVFTKGLAKYHLFGPIGPCQN